MRIVAVGMAMDLDRPSRDELIHFPTRTLDERGRTHLATHGQRFAVGADGVEIQI